MELRDSLRTAMGVERVGVWSVAALTVAVVFVVATAGGSGLVGPPTAAFTIDYDENTSAVAVTKTTGDSLQAERVSLVVTDTEGHDSTVAWPTTDDGEIDRGDSIVIDDATADSDGDGDVFDGNETVGFALTPGTTVEVVWTGRPIGAPDETTVTLVGTDIGAGIDSGSTKAAFSEPF